MRLLILVFLVALASAGGTQAATPVNGPVTLVTTLYKTYAWEAVIDQPDLSSFDLFEQPRSVLARYFDAHLVTLILQDRECAEKTHEVCRLDFMPMWSGQDPGATDLIIQQTHKAEIVSVQFRYPGIELPQSNLEWATSGISRAGMIDNGGSYRKHGYGCAVRLGRLEVDFDFNETGGIKEPDAFRLINFCGARFAEYGFTSKHDLASVLAAYV